MFKRFLKDESGTTIVEFSIIAVLLMVLTFGVMDTGYALWQWNNAEKATQIGVRLAAVSNPVANGLGTFDCGTSTIVPGMSCTNTGALTFGTITCSGKTQTCDNASYPFSTAEATRVLQRMQRIFPQVKMENLVFQYEDLRLAFAGRRSPVASVTVRMVNLTFNFIVLDAFLGTGPIPMPDFRATLTTEDLNSAG